MMRGILVSVLAGLTVLAAQENIHFLPHDRIAVRVMRDVPAIELAPGVRVRTVVGATGSFSIGDFDPGSAAVLHHHEREQADVGIAGVFDMTIGTHVEALGPGEGVVVPPNVAHSIGNVRGGVMTVIEFHTIRRPDLVPPRPTMTFPAAPKPTDIAGGRRLVVRLDAPGVPREVRGETCTLSWRPLPKGGPPIDIRPVRTRTERFVYVVRGDVELIAGTVERPLGAGTLVVIPPEERVVRMRAVGAADAALAEFSPEVLK